MKIYLVGGAVRDKALGLPMKERDWVVVGGTPEDLIAQGYKQVGRDFPVFLHPETGEEYALARKERKSGHGYLGFICDFDPEVTLEEDLARRDLTINAIALDESGHWIDPYHGLEDIRQKKLRHVSAAFVEDPVRILRVARFAARFHPLGFHVAPETRQLMYQMVRQKEAHHLISERVWQEWQKSLTEQHPEIFIHILRACGALEVILPELNDLFGVPNGLHEDAATRMLNRLKYAALFSENPIVRFASLLLEIGKGHTPIALWPQHPEYIKDGVSLLEGLCERLRIPNAYHDLARLGIRFHAWIADIDLLSAQEILNVLEGTDAFRRPDRFLDILKVAQSYHQNEKITQQWHHLIKICTKIAITDVQHLSGEAIKEALHTRRLNCIDSVLNQGKNLNEK